MFGWFSSEAPVPADVREWIEFRSRWLVRSFGAETLRGVRVVLPSREFFPDPFDGSPDAAVSMFARVCGYMGADATGVRINLTEVRSHGDFAKRLGLQQLEGHQFAAGTYESGSARISVERGQLSDPIALAATLAHEVAHLRLIGESRSEQEADEEPLTELCTVFLGTGVFGANSYVRETRWTSESHAGWESSRLGYFSRQQWGYALALHSWFRGEERPAVDRWLRPDIRSPFRQARRYLRKHGPPLGSLPAPKAPDASRG